MPKFYPVVSVSGRCVSVFFPFLFLLRITIVLVLVPHVFFNKKKCKEAIAWISSKFLIKNQNYLIFYKVHSACSSQRCMWHWEETTASICVVCIHTEEVLHYFYPGALKWRYSLCKLSLYWQSCLCWWHLAAELTWAMGNFTAGNCVHARALLHPLLGGLFGKLFVWFQSHFLPLERSHHLHRIRYILPPTSVFAMSILLLGVG